MFDERMEALAAGQHGVVSYDQAVALGLSESAIRHQRQTGQWRNVFRGVYSVAGAVQTPRLRATAAVMGGGPGAVLSHGSAAGLLGLPGFAIDPVTISRPRGRRLLEGIRVEQSLALPIHHRRIVDGIPCTSVSRTLFDLCGDVRPRRAERALDNALSRRRVTLPALWRVLDDLAVQGRAGVVLLRALLTERGPRYVAPESELEARFLELAARRGLRPPERQVDLGDSDAWIGRVDFVWRSAHLIVEVDGAAYHDGMLDQRRDRERDERLTGLGWTVLRFSWHDILDRPTAVADDIKAVLHPDCSFRGTSPSL